MKAKSKLLRVFALVAALTLVVTACGDSGGSDDTSTEGGTVTVMAKWGEGGGEGDAFVQVLDAFTAATGIEVVYNGVGDELPTILSTQVENNDPPDVAILPQPGLLKDLAARGALKSIEEAAGDELDASFAGVWRELGSVDGTLYGVFFKGSNKSTVWYDVNVFTDNGITPPTTWDEWLAASDTLVAAGVTPVAVGGADGWTLSDWFENVYLRTAGPELYDQLTNHEIPWTHDSVKEAFEVMGQLIGVDENVARGTDGALQVGFGDSVKLVFGDAPEAAIVFEGDFVGGVIASETSAQAGTDFDFFDFPSIDGSPPSVVGGGDVAVVLTDNPAAMRLVEYLATAEAGEIWAALGGFSSPNRDVDVSVYPDDIARKAAEALANAEQFRFDLSDLVPAALGGTAGSGIWGGLQDWLGNGDIDAALQSIEADAQAAQG